MTSEELKAEKLYQRTMYMARHMYEEDIITKDEYKEIEAYFVSKYSPVYGSLISSLWLLSDRKGVMYVTNEGAHNV